MNLKDAFAGIAAAREEETPDPQTSVQTLERLDAQTPKRLDAQTAKRLAGEEKLARARRRPDVQALRRSDAQTLAQTAKRSGPQPGKSNHPEFEKVTIYVRRDTRQAAWRKWEDLRGGDFSDLIQQLLVEFLDA